MDWSEFSSHAIFLDKGIKVIGRIFVSRIGPRTQWAFSYARLVFDLAKREMVKFWVIVKVGYPSILEGIDNRDCALCLSTVLVRQTMFQLDKASVRRGIKVIGHDSGSAKGVPAAWEVPIIFLAISIHTCDWLAMRLLWQASDPILTPG